ncbi:MAG: methyltransferase domain-containing protein [Candidatus Omnitrophota bacterium]
MKAIYNWDAKEYHKSSSEQQKWAKELIGKLNLRGDERVLDIGCGDGKVSVEIAKCLPKGFVLGIDNSQEMIRFALKNFPPEKFSNLVFEKIDAIDLPFDNEFDIVFSNACLHWVIDHLSVLKRIKKSLKQGGGKVLIQMGGKGNAAKILEVLEEMLKENRWSKFYNGFAFPYGFYEAEEYKRWLNEAGLKPTRIELIPKDMAHKGKEGLLGWIRTTWLPYIQRLPEELWEEFINELADRYIEKHPLDKDGFVHIAMIRLEVEAENID